MLHDKKVWVGTSGEEKVYIYPKMANRHGMIAGATGTGKTVTLKVLAKVDNAIHHNLKMAELYIEFENNKSISEFFDEMRKNDVKVLGFEIGKSKIKGEGPNVIVRLEMPKKGMHPKMIEKIRLLEGVHFVEEFS